MGAIANRRPPWCLALRYSCRQANLLYSAHHKAHDLSTLCLVRHADDPVPLTVLSSWEGSIGHKELGSGGFGYDPLFVVTGRNCTAAQLPPQIKNLISHRARALQALTYKLEHNLS